MSSVTLEHSEVDVVVVGAGSAGLTAALSARANGLDVLVVEKTEYIGGTTAYSGGTCWAPGNKYQDHNKRKADRALAEEYIAQVSGDESKHELWRAFLDSVPRMLDDLEKLGVSFLHSPAVIDYHSDLPNTGATGRALEPKPFNGRKLGTEKMKHVRPPVREFALLNGELMVRRPEVNRLLGLYSGKPAQVIGAVGLAMRLGLRWAVDRLKYHRCTRLVMGNALVASLYYQLLERGGQVWLNSQVNSVIREDAKVCGVEVQQEGRAIQVTARRGVILAGGGFPQGQLLKLQNLPHMATQMSRAGEGSTGSSISLGLSVGGQMSKDEGGNAFWFPTSTGRRRDGSRAVFPHIWDRGRPGSIIVNSRGERFVDETLSYHEVGRALLATSDEGPNLPAWLVTDARGLRKYGFGMVTFPHLPKLLLNRYIKDGYLITAESLESLADKLEVDAKSLLNTVQKFNGYAKSGVDRDFGRGDLPFGRASGDPENKPNPTLGPISEPPYYAIPIFPTPLATSKGLVTNQDAQVVDESGEPIEGLYAVGNDAASMSGNEYLGAGAMVGTGMTFGWIAAKHLTNQ